MTAKISRRLLIGLSFIICHLSISVALTSCSDDTDPTYLDEVKVSSSYVAIPQDGGSTDITVNATGEWAFAQQRWIAGKDTTVAAAPKWLTVSTTQGSAGQTTISFSAESTLDGRTCELLLTCGDKTQRINVIQGLSTVSNATCAEVIAGPDSKTYRVTGTVTSIANTTYGNWYLNDGTGQIYIYGTLDSKGATKNFSSWGLDVGDEITVEGPKTTYNGTVELVDVTVIQINKSLIKVDSLSSNDPLPAEGGEVTASVTCKGQNISVSIPDDAKSWLVMSDVSAPYITFRALPNEGDYRKTTVTFKTTDGKKEYTAQATIAQEAKPNATGSEKNPFTVAEAIAKCKEIGSTASDQMYYATGIISSIKEVSTSYGNATFNISDNGEDVNALTCFRANSLGGAKFAAEDEISVGDEVLICGKLVNYKDESPQFAQGCYIVTLKKGNAAGSLTKPFTPAEANAFCQALGEGVTTTDDYYVKGKIVEITEKNQFGLQYGNGTFHISADGTEGAEQFYVFRTLYLGNVKYTDESWLLPKVGDEVVICGKLTLYKDKNGNLVPETSANNSYIYSLNGKTE
jgi:hypothetical protein